MQTETAPDRRSTANDSFRRHAALEILKTLLLDDRSARLLWERYMRDDAPARLAVELADDLIVQLSRVQ